MYYQPAGSAKSTVPAAGVRLWITWPDFLLFKIQLHISSAYHPDPLTDFLLMHSQSPPYQISMQLVIWPMWKKAALYPVSR
jgi:hypothetical protein